MNPWTLIGWLVLGWIVLYVGSGVVGVCTLLSGGTSAWMTL